MHHYRIIVEISIGENDIDAYWGNNPSPIGIGSECVKGSAVWTCVIVAVWQQNSFEF
jgi:hypothetical protein